MAKKPRTPDPPRRVQAPKQRHAPRRGLDAQRQRLLLYGVAGAGIVALVVVLVVIVGGGGSGGAAGDPNAIAATMRAGGCTISTSQASPSNQHVADGTTVTYSTYPAVSGRHLSSPAIFDRYTQEVDPRAAVHNLEHGAVVIWVGPDVSQQVNDRIAAFWNESPNAILVTPIANTTEGAKYPKHAPPDSKIYLTAWTVDIEGGQAVSGTNVIATCTRFDEAAFTAFRDEFRGKGPERFKVSDLSPGT